MHPVMSGEGGNPIGSPPSLAAMMQRFSSLVLECRVSCSMSAAAAAVAVVPIAVEVEQVLVVEGLIGRDKNGVFYALQSVVFTYDSSNLEQSKMVDDNLKKSEAKWNSIPNCFCSRFKLSSTDTLFPMAVGRLTRGFKTKGVPDEEVEERVVKKRRK